MFPCFLLSRCFGARQYTLKCPIKLIINPLPHPYKKGGKWWISLFARTKLSIKSVELSYITSPSKWWYCGWVAKVWDWERDWRKEKSSYFVCSFKYPNYWSLWKIHSKSVILQLSSKIFYYNEVYFVINLVVWKIK